MTEFPTEDQSRMERRRRSRLLGRAALIGGLVILVLALLGGGYWVWRMSQAGALMPPSKLVVIAESELEDGTKVAGAVVVIEGESLRPIDTLAPADIPGTAYDRLRDALSLGGPDLVAQLASEDGDDVGWLLLDEQAWAQLIDEAGGIRIDLLGSTTVFTGEKLFRFSKGPQTLQGGQAVALLRGSETLSGKASGAAARQELGRAIARAALADASATRALVERGEAESSEQPQALSEFMKSVDR